MKIYHYHAITKEYMGEGEADLSPLDHKKGNEVWLVPANATQKTPPPAEYNKVRKFIDGEWTQTDREV